MPRFRDLAGQIFGRLTVLHPVGQNKAKQYIWECQCSCGVRKSVTGTSLIEGYTTSCGCWKFEARRTHGQSLKRLRKGSAYSSWEHMKQRCLNKNHKHYAYYGGRGVSICDRWLHSFENFLADMGPKPSAKHTLDRWPDPYGNYEVKNCRWATRKEQSRNLRPRSNEARRKQTEKAVAARWTKR